MRWKFTIYKLTETWVAGNIDSLIYKYVRKWLQFPVSANADHLSFPYNKLGVNFKSAKSIYNQCKLSNRRILKRSQNPEIRTLYKLTSTENVNQDSILNNISTENDLQAISNKQFKAKVDRTFNVNEQNKVWKKFMNLNEQQILISHIIKVCPSKIINMWQALTKRLPSNIFNFCRKALILALPNKSNLFRWKIITDNMCILCENIQTQLHVLLNCNKCLVRYTWRHDSVLNSLVQQLCQVKAAENIYCDCNKLGYKNTSQLFQSQRPDIAIIEKDVIVVIELTVCYETNSTKSREYKKNRYKDLKDQLLVRAKNLKIYYLELTSLGFISKESYDPFNRYLKELKINGDHAIYKCMETIIRSSYYIFCRRNKSWTDPDLLNYP